MGPAVGACCGSLRHVGCFWGGEEPALSPPTHHRARPSPCGPPSPPLGSQPTNLPQDQTFSLWHTLPTPRLTAHQSITGTDLLFVAHLKVPSPPTGPDTLCPPLPVHHQTLPNALCQQGRRKIRKLVFLNDTREVLGNYSCWDTEQQPGISYVRKGT